MKSPSRTHTGRYDSLPLSDRTVLIVLTVILSAQVFLVLARLNGMFLTETPVRHGELREGILGAPGKKNPLYAKNPAEKDITALIHAGLLKRTGDGYETELARTWEKKNGNEYVFHIKRNAFFHDGSPVTAKDIVHTVSMVKEDPNARYHAPWKDVKLHVVDAATLSFTVPEETTDFPEGFTVPILPEHVWKKIAVRRRNDYDGPGVRIGAGPYRYDRERFTPDGRPTEMTLSAFSGYVLGKPYIEKMTLVFLPDAETLFSAYREKTVDMMRVDSPADIPMREENGGTVKQAPTDRVVGVFFNASEGRVPEDPFIRSILSKPAQRSRIITEVLHHHADAIDGPISTDAAQEHDDTNPDDLAQTLEDIGWKFEGLSGQRKKDGRPFTLILLSTDTEKMKSTADILAESWRRLGADVEIKTVADTAPAIAKRDFDAVLHEYEADTPEDLIALWKSDERKNFSWITGFGSPILNNLLDELTKNTPPERLKERLSTGGGDNWRGAVYDEIKVEMNRGVPAAFLYSPRFLYVIPETVMGTGLGPRNRISEPEDRFADVHRWHIKRERVWIFLTDRVKQKQHDNHTNT